MHRGPLTYRDFFQACGERSEDRPGKGSSPGETAC